jgi:hypothetical protein
MERKGVKEREKDEVLLNLFHEYFLRRFANECADSLNNPK